MILRYKSLQVVLALWCLLVFIPDNCGWSSPVKAHGAANTAEEYQYRSSPKGKRGRRNEETVLMTFHVTNESVECLSQTVGDEFIEDVSVTTDLTGQLISAKRTRKKKAEEQVLNQCRIWLEADKVHVQTTKNKTTVSRILDSRKTAVDVSLLYLMRLFPFETDDEWQVFMADFSGRFITVSIRNSGTEHVTVPAGQFQCYRMEVAVRVAILKASINYWLTTAKPHFLVKHEGKKGPFTKTYTTVLETSPRSTTDRGAEQSPGGNSLKAATKE